VLRLLLPPNLASAAPRNAIAVRLELNLAASPPPGLVAGLAVLQRLGAKPAPVSFLQLTRAQLAELTDALAGQPVFFWLNRPTEPIAWNGADLAGVDEFLAPSEPPAAKPTVAVTPAAAPPRAARREPAYKPMTVDGSEHFLAITLPAREADNYHEIWELLKRSGFVLEPSNGKFWLRDRHKTLNFLATHGTALRGELGAEFTDNFTRNTAHLHPAGLVAEAKEAGDGYDVTLGLKAGDASEAEILRAVGSSRGYIESGRDIYLVDPVRLAQLQAAHQALAGAPRPRADFAAPTASSAPAWPRCRTSSPLPRRISSRRRPGASAAPPCTSSRHSRPPRFPRPLRRSCVPTRSSASPGFGISITRNSAASSPTKWASAKPCRPSPSSRR
jgi:hypothetical protein